MFGLCWEPEGLENRSEGVELGTTRRWLLAVPGCCTVHLQVC